MNAVEQRRGMFWDFLAGRVAPPPAARTLGWELEEIDPEAGTIRVRFDARPDFINPVGAIQGGFLAAMLDDTLGPALVATLEPDQFAPTLELKVSFLRPARPRPPRRHSAGRAPGWRRRLPGRGVVRYRWAGARHGYRDGPDSADEPNHRRHVTGSGKRDRIRQA